MSLQAQPLVWGHGARTFEVFLEPTCPFSVKTFNKLDALLALLFWLPQWRAAKTTALSSSGAMHNRGI